MRPALAVSSLPESPPPRSPFTAGDLRLPGLLLLGLVAAAAGCHSAPRDPGPVTVSPDAVTVGPGAQIQFTVVTPAGLQPGQVAWSVAPECPGSISSDGLFTAGAAPPAAGGSCAVTATLLAKPDHTGHATVHFASAGVQADGVQASGGGVGAGEVTLHAVIQEPVSAIPVRDTTGAVESRGGFYPAASTSTP